MSPNSLRKSPSYRCNSNYPPDPLFFEHHLLESVEHINWHCIAGMIKGIPQPTLARRPVIHIRPLLILFNLAGLTWTDFLSGIPRGHLGFSQVDLNQ